MTTPLSSHYWHIDAIGIMSIPFIGREDLVKAILAYFADEPTESYKRPRVLSIWGLAGEGKSRLALEVSLRSRERYSGVYWVNASTDVTAMQSFETLAAEFGSKGGFDQQEYNVSVKFVRDQLKSRNARWLMVFDSYDRPEDFPDVKRLIPSGIPIVPAMLSCLTSIVRWTR
jgi:hypothetical protein